MGQGAPKTLKLLHPLSSVRDAPLRRLDLQLLSRWGHHTQFPRPRLSKHIWWTARRFSLRAIWCPEPHVVACSRVVGMPWARFQLTL
jgi:hypothetical protein